jgi:hypothetical protein
MTFEEIVGDIIAGLLIILFIISICMSLFKLVFRDGHGLGLYGGRGNSYFYDE